MLVSLELAENDCFASGHLGKADAGFKDEIFHDALILSVITVYVVILEWVKQKKTWSDSRVFSQRWIS